MANTPNARPTPPRIPLRRQLPWESSQLGAYLRDVASRKPLDRAAQRALAARLSEATDAFRLAVYAIPWTAGRVLAIWHEARENGRASHRMSDSFGAHASEDRDRLERCLERLEAGWRAARAEDMAGLLVEAGLSHEILRGLHSSLRDLECLAELSTGGGQDAKLLEKEVGLPLRAFRERMQDVHAAFDRMTALKNELVEHNLRLVLTLVSQFSHLGLPLADLVQEGNTGLLRAAERYDPGRGVAFATYALWWIRHGLVRAVQNHGRTVRVPTHKHEAVRNFRKQEGALERKLGREATCEETAAALGLDEQKLDELRHLQAPVLSLDAELDVDPERAAPRLADVLADPSAHQAVESVDRASVLGCVLAEFEHLPERERRVLMLRYGLGGEPPRSLREVGAKLSISAERVRQLESSALGGLRRRFRA